MTDVVQGINIKALVLVQVTKRKKEKKDSTVVEAFRHKYIKVNLDDEEDHNVLELRWNGEVYEGSFMCTTMMLRGILLLIKQSYLQVLQEKMLS